MRSPLLLVVIVWVAGGNTTAQTAESAGDLSFFPIAVWTQDPQYASVYKENGINLYINIYGGLNREKMEHLRRAGMRVVAHQNEYALTQLKDTLIYAWINGDEPDNAQRNRTTKKWDPCIDPADVIREYRRIKKHDPSRPVYLNVGRGVAHTNWRGRGVCKGRTDMYPVSNNGYLKGCDIASFSCYPVNTQEEEVHENLWYIAKGIDSLRSWSNHQKPAWCWIETTRISEKSKRQPTPAEVKAEVWMALVHGAKGFGYFCHSFIERPADVALLNDPGMLQAVGAINREVAALAPVLNSPDTDGYARVHGGDPEVPIHILTKKDLHANYIFAVAMRKKPTRATFRVKKGRTVEVIGENRTIRIKNKRFRDAFADYGVHLYRITR